MITLAWIVAAVAATLAAVLRTGAASLVMTPRADALHDAAEGRRGADRVARLLEHPEVIVPSINIVHSLLLVLAAVPSTWVIAVETAGTATAALLGGLVVGLTVFADLAPRVIGRSRPRVIAYRFGRVLGAAIALGSSVVEILSDDAADEDDGDDAQDEEEVGLIESVLIFAETIVREVMVPRTDMVTIAIDADIDSLLAVIDENGYSRIPVAGEGGLDDIVGVVIAKDLLPRLANGERPVSISEVMRPVEHIPETKRVPELLRDMQVAKSHLAIVVDEFGGTAGLVTIEDLLEELVGEIVDEYDEDELMVEELEDGSWKVDGRLSVHDLSEMIDRELPNDEWDTVAGLVLGLAGRVPRERETFETAGVSLTVRRVQGRRVQEVLVRRLVTSESTPDSR
ncbi:MAG TPA: hemolysin family protein [Acidimicrobiia bacterium]|nr:hemolysin family protein [Acidimicrobiia bacterium]